MTEADSRKGYVDVFRGLLIAHMALDHASLMFNANRSGEELWVKKPEFPHGLAEFLARFTGIPVAPGFFMMAGFMVAWTSLARAKRGVPEREITKRLVVRGVVLLLADAVIGGIPRAFGGYYSFVVLSSIGAGIILTAYLRRLSQLPLLGLALAILALHPLIDLSGIPTPLRAVLHEPVREGAFRSLYPIVPWVGMLLLGFVVGRDAYRRGPREGLWLALGALSLALFFLVRLPGGYGNAYPHGGVTSREFWHFAKYPPDLPFITLAYAAVFPALALVHRLCKEGVPRWLHPFTVYGRVSFFFYLTHFYVLGPARGLIRIKMGIDGVLVVWLCLLAVMYPLCNWYYRKKTERPNFVTRYL